MKRFTCLLAGIGSLLAIPAALADDSVSRIISAGGSLSEWVVELGAENRLVGVDTTSSHPKQLTQLPSVGYQRQLAAEGVLALKPQLVLGTEEMGPRPVLEQLAAAGVKVQILPSDADLSVLNANLLRLGELLQAKDAADQAWQQFEQQLTQATPKATVNKPKMLMLFGAQHGSPLVAGKNTVAHWLIEQVGAENLAQHRGYKALSNEALLGLNPEVLVIADRSAEQQHALTTMLSSLPSLAKTQAVQHQQVISMDPTLLVGGLGPRLPAEVARWSQIIYPALSQQNSQ
ncbi:hypothetical protein AKN93_06850 [Thiopseudomonas alkaliphila]|uniref:heme/hemin ABC transporter substrate-binding protein n=1 Tax=Thiopseudomonas alkaliphila TaxID=1697053 RepID=UPI00069E55D7|nr:ABC transporter substrate-binding protein [Thiopseudomonas alkaliphila]AKX46072.1 hypothetical protein AKN94_00820 [Thiopseudomonas alkaliphila]AKX49156.1 hypothetical protein AKN93_06850 [Thiopseudomonas alkaliphila]AKX58178.1 hypothetical protein AKN89_10500 [Thiopseudomonas alkaliphila]